MHVNSFWDKFEELLRDNVAARPCDYALRVNEAPEQYAKQTRIKMQANASCHNRGLSQTMLDSITFKQLFRFYCPSQGFSQSKLRAIYNAMDGN